MLLALLACSSYKLSEGANDAATSGPYEDSGKVGQTSDTSTPVYWRAGASLDGQDGIPRTGPASTVSVAPLDSESNPLCETSLPVKGASSKPVPDEAIYAWWLLTLEPDSTCDSGVASLLLGI